MSTPTLQYHKGKKRYFARLQLEGVRRRFWFGGSQKDAAKALQQKAKDIATGKVVFAKAETTATVTVDGKKDMRLEELIHRHLSWVQVNRSPATYELRRRYLQAFLDFAGPCMVSQITRSKLSDFHTWARQSNSQGHACIHYLREVRTMLRWAEEEELCDCPVRRFPTIHASPSRTTRFTDEEIAKLLTRIPECSFRDMLVFGLLTGLRPQELRGLRKSEVAQDAQGRCHVVIEKHKTSKTAREPQPRSVPLPQAAAAIVRRHVDSHPDSEHIFLSDTGVPYSAGVYRRKLERWCKRARIPAKPPYALRHTFATLQAEGDANIVVLGQLMGHTNTRTTARYIHASAAHHLQAVDRTAAHILALVPRDGAKSETGQKVATKVATPSVPGNEAGGRVSATACQSAS